MTENLFYKIYNTDGQLLMNTMNMHGMMAGMDRETESYQTAMYDVTVEDTLIGKIQVLYSNKLLDDGFCLFKKYKTKYLYGSDCNVDSFLSVQHALFKTIVDWL